MHFVEDQSQAQTLAAQLGQEGIGIVIGAHPRFHGKTVMPCPIKPLRRAIHANNDRLPIVSEVQGKEGRGKAVDTFPVAAVECRVRPRGRLILHGSNEKEPGKETGCRVVSAEDPGQSLRLDGAEDRQGCVFNEPDPGLIRARHFPGPGVVGAHEAGFCGPVFAGVLVHVHQQPGQFIPAPEQPAGIFGQGVGDGFYGGVIKDQLPPPRLIGLGTGIVSFSATVLPLGILPSIHFFLPTVLVLAPFRVPTFFRPVDGPKESPGTWRLAQPAFCYQSKVQVGVFYPAGLDDDASSPADTSSGHGQDGAGRNFQRNTEGFGRCRERILNGGWKYMNRHGRRWRQSGDLGRLARFLPRPDFLSRRFTERGGDDDRVAKVGRLSGSTLRRMAAGAFGRIGVEVDH
ncbi:hypothetical protein NY78_2114 [Desulfovibrio sp. TomC]|nr:hypothetical protein NY78_2114 [Desulfovibrio sp. TomC]